MERFVSSLTLCNPELLHSVLAQVFSIKASGSDISAENHTVQPFNRHRHYYETPSRDLFGDDVEFTEDPNQPAYGATYAWANADRADRGWLGDREGWQDQWCVF